MPLPLQARRFKVLREKHKLSQVEMARVLGLKHRQTVAAVEAGARRLSADELLRLIKRFDTTLEYFCDPFRLEGEGRFSWRQTGVSAQQLRECERVAGTWIAAFRVLAPEVGHPPTCWRWSLGLGRDARTEDVRVAGAQFVKGLGLGEIPGERLAEVMEERLGILVLMVDGLKGVSGVACQLPDLNTVLIERGGVEGQRNFDLARELFQLLAWDSMPPERSGEARTKTSNRVERLADCFAGAVLMPVEALGRPGSWKGLGRGEVIERLGSFASRLRVTSSALRRRLVALGELERSVADSLPERALRDGGRAGVASSEPAPYSRPFARVRSRAIDEGLISTRRAARLLKLGIDEMYGLFETHGVELPYRL